MEEAVADIAFAQIKNFGQDKEGQLMKKHVSGQTQTFPNPFFVTK